MPDTQRYTRPLDDRPVDGSAAWLWAAGAAGVWERGRELVAWFPHRDVPVPPGGHWELEPDRDWQAEWKATIAPVRAGHFLVVPTWLADDTPAGPDDTVLVLDPGRAFGSGHHATTTLCLELLDERDLDGRSVADVGCGTGVLAIAAAKRGALVNAVDIDPDAVEVARDNAGRNNVEVAVLSGSVADLPAPADVVVANLVTDTVIALATDLAAATGDTLIVSGVAVERVARVRDAVTRAGLTVTEERRRDGWAALVATAAPPGASS